MKRALSLSTATALAVGGIAVALTAAPAATAAPVTPAVVTTGGAYQPITPVRALDTRTSNTPLTAGTSRTLDLSAFVKSASATAVVLNVTVASPTGAGFLTVYPTGQARPLASSINFRPGEIRSNSVTVALPTGSTKSIDLFNLTGSTPTIVDVVGYYDPDLATSSLGATYEPVSPERVLDTRTANGGGALATGTERTVTLPEKDLGNVSAVAVNVTAVAPTGQGYLTAYNSTGAEPFVSTVNYGTDPVTPNFAVVPATTAADGTVSFRIADSSASTQVVVDVVGYYSPGNPTGDLYVPVAPSRLADTRTGTGTTAAPLGAGETRVFPYAAPQNGINALSLNVTVVDATRGTFLTVFPSGANRPLASNLNAFTPAALANAVQTPVLAVVGGSALGFSAYNLAGSVNVVVDLQGYFVSLL